MHHFAFTYKAKLTNASNTGLFNIFLCKDYLPNNKNHAIQLKTSF